MDRLPIPVFLGFPGGSAGKETACNVGHLGLIPGLGRSPGERDSYPLQCSGEFHGLSQSQTRLSHFYFPIYSSMYMSIPISQFILPPSLPTLVTITVFYICDSISICTMFLDSTYKWYHMIFIFLTSLSMTISVSIHVPANSTISFFF